MPHLVFQSALAQPPSVEEMRDIFKEHGLRASQKELEQYTGKIVMG